MKRFGKVAQEGLCDHLHCTRALANRWGTAATTGPRPCKSVARARV